MGVRHRDMYIYFNGHVTGNQTVYISCRLALDVIIPTVVQCFSLYLKSASCVTVCLVSVQLSKERERDCAQVCNCCECNVQRRY